MTLTYTELRKIQRICRDSTGLYELDDDFMGKVSMYLAEKKEIMSKNKDKGNPFSEEMKTKVQEEMKNALKVVNDIFQMREKKVIYRAILSAKKEKPIYDTSRMLEHEKELFNKVVKYLIDYRKKISVQILDAEKVKVKKEENVVVKAKFIRFTEDVPEFVWENEKHGSFEKEDMANLPEELADLLIKREKAVEVSENENT